ncbi:uncharacterized protein LOC6553403 isoform X2 [Drosophila erecta]|uniref:uncharacterized protein LOC6553403 isoform X2 n=1 Tax=Drosophila erecta TaxID=7220 RepID=UPI000F0523E7|nr:uncharacterized protein LOC6553403 isoform X2 [Drosophila erecta]
MSSHEEDDHEHENEHGEEVEEQEIHVDVDSDSRMSCGSGSDVDMDGGSCYDESETPLSCLSHRPTDRTSLPESHAAEEEKATHILHAHPGGRVGEAVPQAEVSGIRGAGGTGPRTEDDRCPGEDVVPEPTHQVETTDGRGARGGAAGGEQADAVPPGGGHQQGIRASLGAPGLPGGRERGAPGRSARTTAVGRGVACGGLLIAAPSADGARSWAGAGLFVIHLALYIVRMNGQLALYIGEGRRPRPHCKYLALLCSDAYLMDSK